MQYAYRKSVAATAAILALAMLAGGCERRAGIEGPKSARPGFTPVFTGARQVARVGTVYDIYTVDPNAGPLAGGNPATLSGRFPNPTTPAQLQAVLDAYAVYFGGNIAPFDTSMNPYVTASRIYVTVPPGDAPGFVDVILRDTTTQLDAAALYDGYEYLFDFDVTDAIPDMGPLSGGNEVRVAGTFPVAMSIATAAQAYASYGVYFGGRRAAFSSTVTPVATNDSLYVVAPPGAALGLVDVSVETEVPWSVTPETRVLTDGYEYVEDFAIIEVIPGAGPLPGGQEVRVIGRYPILASYATAAAAYASYRVYFDGRPAAFNSAFTPVMTTDTMYVITPPGTMPGLVDVSVATVVLPTETPEFRVLTDGYLYQGIFAVDPQLGWIFGDEATAIFGGFPVSQAFIDTVTATNASNYYYARFGNSRAVFDPFVPTPVITKTEMRVRTPVGENVGFTDVSVDYFDENGDLQLFDTLARAYRYYAMYLVNVIPPQGPLSGGNFARLEGFFPGVGSLNDVVVAEQIYSVYFGGNQAAFASVPPNPVILYSQMDAINRTYTTGFMYVTVPPGAALGFVDVRIEDDTDLDLPTTLTDGYEYIGAEGIARWDTADIQPNPVGRLAPGELLVTITGLGEITGTAGDVGPVFIVPQGGDPTNPDHRIELVQVDYSESGGEFTWQGTNEDAIPRIINSAAGELLVDGHAALFIDAGDGELLGDDLSDLSDSGRIQTDAQENRHFLIDTIPPRLYVPPNLLYGANQLRGDYFVSTDIPGNWLTNPSEIDGGAYPTVDHPYPLPTFNVVSIYDAPFDGRTMFRPTNPDFVAQVFFNVNSLTNGFVDSATMPNLQFEVENVIFEDVDIYTMLGRSQAGGLNADYFGGGTARQVAGFETGFNVTLTGLDRDEAFVTDPDLMVSWELLPTPFNVPNIAGIDVTFAADAGSPPSATAPSSLSPNLDPTPTRMRATYSIGDPGLPTTTGVDVNSAGLRTLLSVIFRGVDRAGDYFPRGDASQGKRKLWTADDRTSEGYVDAQQPIMGPLNLWWLRTTGTRVTPSVPSGQDTRTASFRWDNTGTPDPRARIDFQGDGIQREYSYAIFRSEPGKTRDEQRDGTYTMAVPWSGWSNKTSLNAVEVQNLIDTIPDGITEDVWFLIVVVSVDEAGNVELWPGDQLDITLATIDGSSTSPSEITTVTETGAEERNWARWFVPALGEDIETIVEPFFWHDVAPFDGTPNTNVAGQFIENTFGDAEVIPLPPSSTFPRVGLITERVVAQFRVTLQTLDPDATLDWSLLRNGQEVLFATAVPQNPTGSFEVSLTIPTELPLPDQGDIRTFLGSVTREPTHYVFQAATVNGDGTRDSSPANVAFVVVDNVARYIQNPDETQPIREMDRR